MAVPVHEYLKSLPRFSGIGDTELMGIARCARPHSVARSGAVLFEEGDEADGAYIVRAGRLSVEIPMPDGTRRVVATLGAGTMVGELCLIENAPRSLQVRATEPTDLVVIDRVRFQELREKGHSGAYKLIRNIALTICERLRSTNLQIQDRLEGQVSGTQEMEVVRIRKQPSGVQKPRSAWDRLRGLFGRE